MSAIIRNVRYVLDMLHSIIANNTQVRGYCCDIGGSVCVSTVNLRVCRYEVTQHCDSPFKKYSKGRKSSKFTKTLKIAAFN